MTALIVLGLAYAAMAAVSLSISRHQDQVFTAELPARPAAALRYGGWALLAVALAPALGAWGTSVGIAGWLGLLTFAGLAVGVQLSYAATSLQWSAPAAAALATMAWCASRL